MSADVTINQTLFNEVTNAPNVTKKIKKRSMFFANQYNFMVSSVKQLHNFLLFKPGVINERRVAIFYL